MSNAFARTCLAAAFCAAAVTSPRTVLSAQPFASAGLQEREPVRFAFRFNVEDLASAKGAKRVYLDLKTQARRACAQEAVSGSRIQQVDQQCIAELLRAVEQRVASKTLTAQLRRDR